MMLVSANGRQPKTKITKYLNFAEENNIKIIEDAAQSLGSYYDKDTHIGLKGDIGSFLLHAKNNYNWTRWSIGYK